MDNVSYCKSLERTFSMRVFADQWRSTSEPKVTDTEINQKKRYLIYNANLQYIGARVCIDYVYFKYIYICVCVCVRTSVHACMCVHA